MLHVLFYITYLFGFLQQILHLVFTHIQVITERPDK